MSLCNETDVSDLDLKKRARAGGTIARRYSWQLDYFFNFLDSKKLTSKSNSFLNSSVSN